MYSYFFGENMSTIKDIAKHTGLALSTVSKYINGGSVRAANRIKIAEAIKVLGYRRNEAARSLKTKRSMTIGILVPNLKSHFDTTILSIIENHLTDAGYGVIICGYHQNPKMESEKLNFLLQKQVDGLIMIPTGQIHQEILEFIKDDTPLVLIDRPLPGIEADTILVDNFQSSYKLTTFLFELGHRKIGIMPGNDEIFTGKMRLKGYLEAHRDLRLSLDYNLVQISGWDMKDGYEAANKLLNLNSDITACLVCGDGLGYGALKAIQEKNIKIPEDISLACYDLINVAEIFRPRISTIVQPIEKIGQLAAERILHLLASKGKPFKAATFKLPTHFIDRDSIGKVH
jgi:LacI family transcriptional regulator, galactose operon repressor